MQKEIKKKSMGKRCVRLTLLILFSVIDAFESNKMY